MTGPDPRELRTKAGTTESPRARAIRIIRDREDNDAAWVATFLHIGDQLARIADNGAEVARQLDQITASVADIAHAVVEQLTPEEES